MKRKLLTVIAITITMTILFSGCSLIRLNPEREANQILASVSADGITLHITQIEFTDYLNSNAQSVFQQYELEEGIEFLLDKKIESKYLIIKAMGALKNYSHRKGVTLNFNNTKKPLDVLTWGEYYYVVKTVNDQIVSTIEEFITDYEQREASLETEGINKEGIASIEFVEGSFEDQYFQRQKVDLKDVKLRIIYEEDLDIEPEEIPVTEAMYKEEFSTEEAGVKKVVVKFDKKIFVDGEEDYEELTAEHEYEVIATRATKEKQEEEEEEIPDRYKAKDEKAEMFRVDFTTVELYNFLGVEECELSPVKVTAISEAYRRLKTNLKNQSRSVESIYDQAFESAVLSALNYELGKQVPEVTLAKIQAEYEYLIETNKQTYQALSEDSKASKFAEAIGSNLESVYYFPKVENIEGYFYVQQILFNFSPEQKEFLEANKGPNDLDNANDWLLHSWGIEGKEGKYSLFNLIGSSIVTKESNPEYDPEDEDSYPFAKDENDEIVERNLFGTGGIYEELQTALREAATAKDKLEIFDNYKYLYNDDPGIMNNEVGYLIPPAGVKSGFYASFVELGRELFKDNASIGNAFIDGNLAYCYTDYGVHVLMIAIMPFEDFPAGEAFTEASNAVGGSFALTQALDLKDTTFKTIIEKKLTDQAKSKAYEDFAVKHLEEAKAHGNIDTKKINKIVKKLKG